MQSGAQTVHDGWIFFKQHGIGSFDAFIYFLAVLQYRDLIGKRFVFARGGVSLIDLVDLETIKISFARVFFLQGEQGRQRSFFLCEKVEETGGLFSGRCGELAAVGVEQRDMAVRVQQRLVVVLSMDICEPFADLIELRQRDQLTVQSA